MTRRSNHARRGKPAGAPAWLWLVGGILIGLVLAGIAVYGGLAPGLRPPAGQPEPAAAGAAPADPAQEPAAGNARPRYDFYTVLPEMEVLIPDSELQAQVRAETPAATGTPGQPATAAVPPSGVRYRLQAGSYRDPRPAEEAKARLALLGISASVQSVNINGATFHRVYVGPYTSAGEVERVKQQLADNGVPAITVREQAP
jgi:cell division protein FtsN